MKTNTLAQNYTFSDSALMKIIVPVVLEQFLTSLMGTVDSVMVSNVGSAAISAVSLVDAINVLIVQVLSALAAGGVIVCSQYLGSRNIKGAQNSAKQLLLSMTMIAALISIIFFIFRIPMLHVIFGSVEQAIMDDSEVYFFYTLISYPFLSIYTAGAAIYRAQGNTRLPLVVSILSNCFNIVGNTIGIFMLGAGVAGAAIPTLLSRVFSAIVITILLMRSNQQITLDSLAIKPDFPLIGKILSIGIPSGIENSMFQLGKLLIQSSVSTMGTIAIAAQAMAANFEGLASQPGTGIGIAMMTVVGQCMGAGKKDEAVYYIKKMTLFAEISIAASAVIMLLLTNPVTSIAGMEAESAALCYQLTIAITCVKPIVWTMSFIPAYGMRAAGDVKFSMIVSTASMWIFRVMLCIYLVNHYHMGPIAVWIGMFADWTVRAIIFTWRFHSRRWLNHHIV